MRHGRQHCSGSLKKGPNIGFLSLRSVNELVQVLQDRGRARSPEGAAQVDCREPSPVLLKLGGLQIPDNTYAELMNLTYSEFRVERKFNVLA